MEARNSALGRAGEQFVLDFERARVGNLDGNAGTLVFERDGWI